MFGGLCALTAAGLGTLAVRRSPPGTLAAGRPSRPPRALRRDDDLRARAAGRLPRPRLGDVVEPEDLGLDADRGRRGRARRARGSRRRRRRSGIVEERVAEDRPPPCRAPSRTASVAVGPGGLARGGRPGRRPAPRRAPARSARPRARRRSASPPAVGSVAAEVEHLVGRGRDRDPCAAPRRSRASRRAASPPGRRPQPSVPLAPSTSTVSSGSHRRAPRDREPRGQARDAAAERSLVADTVRDVEHPCRRPESTTSAISCRPRTQTRRPSSVVPTTSEPITYGGRRRAAVEAAVARSRCRSGSARRSRRGRARRPRGASISSTCGTPPISCRRAARTAIDYEQAQDAAVRP